MHWADTSTLDDPTVGVTNDETSATVSFRDGSTLAVQRDWTGVITDLRLTTPVVPSMSALVVQHSR